MFTPILAESELPAVGADCEAYHLDFKATTAGSSSWEKAKDAAAFANAQGGTILIGVSEDRARGCIRAYVPMDETRAQTCVREFDEAIRQRCRPHPIFDSRSLRVDSRGSAVAVNVWPFIGQPVGVKPELPSGFSNVSAFAFPVRVGTGTIYLTADQLPMFMQPEIRRIAILLLSIPPGERNEVTLVHMKDRDGARSNDTGRSVRLLLDNNDVLLHNTFQFECGSSRFAAPVDSITSIWRNWDGRWIIRAAVAFMPDGRSGSIAVPADW